MSGTLLSGNEAVAHGAWEVGAVVGVGYPGTPSTEALESFAKLPGVRAEWAPNEKVALEVAAGVSMGGSRVLVTMKHVGMNVAADPLFTLAYTGVRGGVVLLAADDPGMHSSQNEQDSRNWGPFAHVPVVEPSDSSEAREMAMQAFEMSERFDLPVILRSTTRISHSKGLVETGERVEREPASPYTSEPAKWLMLPSNARGRRALLDERMRALHAFAEETDLNRVESRSPEIGVVTSGVSYQYVREALPNASVFKVGLSFPLPRDRLSQFANTVERLVVVEEADTYLKTLVRAMGIQVEDVDIPAAGELSPARVGAAFGTPAVPVREAIEGLPLRPPLMCPGCPHRGVFYALRKVKAIVTGDIGCYTLGAMPPLASMDSCVCMGASVGMLHGMSLVEGGGERPVVGVIGDSTFAHSGITGLAHIAYNAGSGTVMILDNRITAMTGHQGNPMMGRTLMGEETVAIDVEKLCEALGVQRVRTIDPHDLEATEKAIREEIAAEGVSVIVAKAPCALLIREREEPYAVDDEACTACGVCLKIGCPAIAKDDDGKAFIDTTLCVGCADCVQVCRFDAIVPVGPACDIGGA